CCCHSSAQDARDVAVGNDLPQYSPAVILIFIHPGPRLGRKRRASQATAPHRRGNSPGTRWRGPSVTRGGCSPTAPTNACVQGRQTSWVSSHQTCWSWTARWSRAASRTTFPHSTAQPLSCSHEEGASHEVRDSRHPDGSRTAGFCGRQLIRYLVLQASRPGRHG